MTGRTPNVAEIDDCAVPSPSSSRCTRVLRTTGRALRVGCGFEIVTISSQPTGLLTLRYRGFHAIELVLRQLTRIEGRGVAPTIFDPHGLVALDGVAVVGRHRALEHSSVSPSLRATAARRRPCHRMSVRVRSPIARRALDNRRIAPCSVSSARKSLGFHRKAPEWVGNNGSGELAVGGVIPSTESRGQSSRRDCGYAARSTSRASSPKPMISRGRTMASSSDPSRPSRTLGDLAPGRSGA